MGCHAGTRPLVSCVERITRRRNAMADLVPIPLALFERLAQVVDVDRVLRSAKLPRSRFNVAKPQGTTAEFFSLWRAVEEIGADPAIGLRLGVEALTDYDNVAVLAALHSSTLGEGLQKLARYKRLVCPEKIWIDVAKGEARMRFQWLLAKGDPPARTGQPHPDARRRRASIPERDHARGPSRHRERREVTRAERSDDAAPAG
jgi:Arabinose-binding domain of AraC transcription regulator, N-term